jgi:membrane protein
MWRPIVQFGSDLKQAAVRWNDHDGSVMAAATAYYLGLSFFPLLLVLIAGLGLFFQYTHLGQDAQQNLLLAISQNMSPQLAEYVGQALTMVKDRSSIGGPIGLATMLITSLAAFGQLEYALDRIWGVPQSESKSMIRIAIQLIAQRFRSALLLLGLGGIVVIVFIAGMVLAGIQAQAESVVDLPDWVWSPIPIVVTFVINAGVFTLLYRLLPRAPTRWIRALQGGLLTAVAWEIGRQLITILVARGGYNAYGVVGAFLAVLLWCYYAVAIVLLGAEYIQVLRARARAERRSKSHPPTEGTVHAEQTAPPAASPLPPPAAK